MEKRGVARRREATLAKGGATTGEPAKAEGGAAVSVPPRRAMLPPPPVNRLQIWGALALGLALLLPPLLIGLGRADTTYTMEKITLGSSQETWLAQHEQGGRNWLIPRWNGEPRVNKGPMSIWINMAAWWPLDPETAEPQTLVHRARLAGVVLALVTAASTFWAGMSVGGIRVAMMAMLAAGTCLLFVRQGRWASYDVHLTGFTALAIASGLWAMRPLKASSGLDRRVLGWLICGLALGSAMLVKQPGVALAIVLPPMALMIAIVPSRRLGNAIGFVFAVAVGALITAPWLIYVVQQASALGLDQPLGEIFTETKLANPANPSQDSDQPFYYYAILIFWVFPWPVWLIGGLFQPWVRGEGDRRRELLIAWVWFVGLLVVLSIAGAKQIRYITPILPATGLLVAQVWAYHVRLADRSVADPGANLLRIPHWVILIGASVLFPLYLLFQAPAARWLNANVAEAGQTILRPDELPGLHPAAIVLAGLALLGLSVFGLIGHFRWRPRRAFAASAVWAVLLMSVVQYAYARSYHSENPFRADAERVDAVVGAAPLYQLKIEGLHDTMVNEEFLFYSQRVVPKVAPDRLDELQRGDEPLYVVCNPRAEYVEPLEARGFKRVLTFEEGTAPKRFLYRRDPSE